MPSVSSCQVGSLSLSFSQRLGSPLQADYVQDTFEEWVDGTDSSQEVTQIPRPQPSSKPSCPSIYSDSQLDDMILQMEALDMSDEGEDLDARISELEKVLEENTPTPSHVCTRKPTEELDQSIEKLESLLPGTKTNKNNQERSPRSNLDEPPPCPGAGALHQSDPHILRFRCGWRQR